MRRQLYSRMRPRMVMRPRTQNKSRRNLLIGSATLLANAVLLFAYFNLSKTQNTQASQIYNGVANFNAESTITTRKVNSSPEAASELSVYPDRVSIGEAATLTIPAENENTLQISVMDSQGRRIFSQIVEKENASDNIIRVVTEKFPSAGTYYLTASGQSSKYLKKIVVL